jgi:hypothetical protein
MNNKFTLEEAIEGVLQRQKQAGHPESYLIDMKRTYNRLLKLAGQHGELYFSDELALLFLKDSKSPWTGEYRHERFLTRNRCLRFLRSYLETGRAAIEKYRAPAGAALSGGFLDALKLCDQSEEASDLSGGSLVKSRRPIRHLLECMAALGCQRLSDIRHGDAVKAIEDMISIMIQPALRPRLSSKDCMRVVVWVRWRCTSRALRFS